MLKIKEAILVEGRYDRNTLSQIVDTAIFQTDGFGIFKNKQQLAMLRRVAERRGLIVLTDSDGAGQVIRSHVKSAIDGKYLKHAYIPDIAGKERRKASPSREGKLGVEGMSREILLEALMRAGATLEGETTSGTKGITKQDFVELGLSGGKNATVKRQEVQRRCNFPERMSANALLEALNLLYTRQELEQLLKDMELEKNGVTNG